MVNSIGNLLTAAAVSGFFYGVEPDSITEDSITSYVGTVCIAQDDASKLLDRLIETRTQLEQGGPISKDPIYIGCQHTEEAPIKVVRRVEKREGWNIVEVEKPNGIRLFLLTTSRYNDKTLLWEGGRLETEKDI